MKWYRGNICNGGRSAMVFHYHCRSSRGEGRQLGKDLQYNYNTGVVLQTFPLADLPPGRSATLQTFPPEDLQHCRPSPGRSATLQTFPHGGRFATLQIFPLSFQIFPGGYLQHCRPSPIFVKFRILIFEYIEKRVLIIIKDLTY